MDQYKINNQRMLISYPRSGHHLLENLMTGILKAHNYRHDYCEFYGTNTNVACGCRQTPCINDCVIQKQHDFNDSVEQNKSDIYLVLYRTDPIEQLEAHFRYDYYKQQGKASGPFNNVSKHKIDYNDEGMIDKCIHFINTWRDFYYAFIDKWVRKSQSNILAIDYNSFVGGPKEYTTKILDHYFPDLKFDNEIVKKAIHDLNIEYKNLIPDFVYQKLRNSFINDKKG